MSRASNSSDTKSDQCEATPQWRQTLIQQLSTPSTNSQSAIPSVTAPPSVPPLQPSSAPDTSTMLPVVQDASHDSVHSHPQPPPLPPQVDPSSSSPHVLSSGTPRPVPTHPDEQPQMPPTWRSSLYASTYHILLSTLPRDEFELFSKGLWPHMYSCDDTQIVGIASQVIQLFRNHVMIPCHYPSTVYNNNSICNCRHFIDTRILPLMSTDFTHLSFPTLEMHCRESFANAILSQLLRRLSSSLQLTVGQGLPSHETYTMPAPLYTSSLDHSSTVQLITNFDTSSILYLNATTDDSDDDATSLFSEHFILHCSSLSSRHDLSTAEVASLHGIPVGPHVGSFSSPSTQRRSLRNNPMLQFQISLFHHNDSLPRPPPVHQSQNVSGSKRGRSKYQTRQGRGRSRNRNRGRGRSRGRSQAPPTVPATSEQPHHQATQSNQASPVYPCTAPTPTPESQSSTPTYIPNRFDSHPSPDMVNAHDPFFSNVRERATDILLAADPYAIIDHLSWHQCVGCEGAHFFEITNLPSKLHGMWAEGIQHLCSDVADSLDTHKAISESTDDLDLRLERRLKMFFLFWLLILRKPPSKQSPNGRRTSQLIKARLDAWLDNDWKSLLDKYEEDVVLLQSQSKPSSSSSVAQQAGNICECFKALSIGKINKATSSLLSLGTSNPSNPGIQDQLQAKHPARKHPILPPTEEQISYERASFTVEEFSDIIKNLGRQVAPGLGGCRNEHLQALLFHDQSPVSDNAKDAILQLHRVCHHIAMCSVPWYFSQPSLQSVW